MTIPIVELRPICVEQAARSRKLFELLGTWVTSTSHPGLQRLFATACHRHAWHAELWEQRRPRIAASEFRAEVTEAVDVAGDDERRAWYQQQLAELGDTLSRIGAATNASLDPSTARTVQLVAADITDLQSRFVG